MNKQYREFILSGRNIANQNGVTWETPTDENGCISKSFIWNLTQMSGGRPTQRCILQKLAHCKKTRLNWPDSNLGSPCLDEHWQDLKIFLC